MRLWRYLVVALGLAIAAPHAAAPAAAQDVQPFIIDGEYATSARGMAAVHVYGSFRCSGSVVHQRWVLTAKHCLFFNETY